MNERLSRNRLVGLACVIVLAGTIATAINAPAERASGAAEDRGLAPQGFLGLGPQTELDSADLRLMADAEVDTIRMPLYWFGVERFDPSFREPDWRAFDRVVELAALEDIRVVPFVWGTPRWVARSPTVEPSEFPSALRRWKGFLRRAVGRYGPDGRFWAENPDLNEHPIRTWQVWNEPNIVTFSREPDPERYGRLLRASAKALRAVDPGSRVVMAGLFGRPLEIPPNIAPAAFLSGALDVPGASDSVDAVALHPYLAVARAIPSKIKAMRDVLSRHGARRAELWVTELGWGSADDESRWEKGLRGQSEELDQALRLLTANRFRWNIERVYWFSNLDVAEGCQFCDSAGLLDARFRAKPSWFAFNDWTGGDADAVTDYRKAKTGG